MKILIINDFVEGGGAEGVFRATIDILREHGHNVISFYGTKEVSTPKNFLSYLYNKNYKKELYRVLLNFNPDIIHIHNYYHILTSSIFISIRKFKERNSKIKVVVTAHDFHLICPSSHLMYFKEGSPKNIAIPVRLKEWMFRSIDKRGIKYSLVKKVVWFFERFIVKPEGVIDVIVSPSYFLIKTFKRSGIENRMICVRNPLKKEKVKKEVNVKERVKDVKVVYFGRLSAEKGLTEFFNLAIANNIQLDVDIYGDGEEREKLGGLLKDNAKIRVNLLGRINNEDLQVRLLNYDVAIIPSVGYENAPLTIPEAAKAGLVIWGTDNGGIREMCEAIGVSYFLFKPNVLDSFKESYTKLSNYIHTKQSFKPKLNKFSEETFYNETLKIYKCK